MGEPADGRPGYAARELAARTAVPARHLTRRAWLAALVALLGVACAGPQKLSPFRTDGCSWWPDRGPISHRSWRHCCVRHDMAYWCGGTEAERVAADEALRRCVEQVTGDAQLAETMYLGVRVGGTAYLPTPFHWGYGWADARSYGPLTPEERQRADELLARWRADHPCATEPPGDCPPAPVQPPEPPGPPAAAPLPPVS